MFGVYFGKYLAEKGIITSEEYKKLYETTKNSRVKLGLLGVESGLLTQEQADEINHIQQQEDKRFGDIAIEKGYLTDEDVSDLLDRQGDAYLLYIQALTEGGFLTLDEIQKELVGYRKDRHITTFDLEAIKTGDIDRIVPIFLKSDEIPAFLKEYIALTARNFVRFVDRFFRMGHIEKVNEYTAARYASQHLTGEHRFYTAFCGEQEGIDELAKKFAKTSFSVTETENIDSLDATNEFLNVNNGLFSTGLGATGANIVLESPQKRYEKTVIRSGNTMYKVPFFVEDREIDLIICVGEDWRLE